MADINIERKRRRLWPLLVTLLLVAAVAAGAWLYLDSQRDGDADAAPAAEVQDSPDGVYTPPAATTTGY